MSHSEIVDFCGFFAGGYVAILLVLRLASVFSERARSAAAYAGGRWPLPFLAFCAAAGLFFYGSHWDDSGTLIAADGEHFADGCPLGGLTLARLHFIGQNGFEVGVLLLGVAVLIRSLRASLKPKRQSVLPWQD